jgi:hypothetical protein
MGAFSDQLGQSAISAFRGSETITASDSTDIIVTRGILVDVGGNVKLTFSNGDVDTLTLVAGMPYSFSVTRIWSTGTTATGLHALR